MPATKVRLEARIDPELDSLIDAAAEQLHVTKTAFVSEAIREAALRVMARSQATLMSAEVYDSMLASLDLPDPSPELADLASLPRRIA